MSRSISLILLLQVCFSQSAKSAKEPKNSITAFVMYQFKQLKEEKSWHKFLKLLQEDLKNLKVESIVPFLKSFASRQVSYTGKFLHILSCLSHAFTKISFEREIALSRFGQIFAESKSKKTPEEIAQLLQAKIDNATLQTFSDFTDPDKLKNLILELKEHAEEELSKALKQLEETSLKLELHHSAAQKMAVIKQLLGELSIHITPNEQEEVNRFHTELVEKFPVEAFFILTCQEYILKSATKELLDLAKTSTIRSAQATAETVQEDKIYYELFVLCEVSWALEMLCASTYNLFENFFPLTCRAIYADFPGQKSLSSGFYQLMPKHRREVLAGVIFKISQGYAKFLKEYADKRNS